MEAVNPTIDWKNGTVAIPANKDQSLALSLSYLVDRGTHPAPLSINPRKQVAVDPEELEGVCCYLDAEFPSDYITRVVDSFVICCIHKFRSQFTNPQTMATIHKLTMSIDLTMQAEAAKPKKTLPAKYAKFTQVFSKEATTMFPPHNPLTMPSILMSPLYPILANSTPSL